MPDYSHITIPSRDDHEAFCDHVIAVERARRERRPLLIGPTDGSDWTLRSIQDHSPLDWIANSYAIASEPPNKVLAPWKLGPELLGKKIKHKHCDMWHLIQSVVSGDSAPIKIGHNNHLSLDFMKKNYVELLPDGTEGPCGTWEEQA